MSTKAILTLESYQEDRESKLAHVLDRVGAVRQPDRRDGEPGSPRQLGVT